jgi:DNA-binding transcriptional ArsR family regulator
MDQVFRALADPTRRELLDELFRADGQTLSALEQRLPMTRFGVMKHLKVLEEAGLVTTRKRGREKHHFLNPVPIRLVHDRWVSKYAEPWAAGLSELKRDMEATMEKVFEIYIRTTPEQLWEAITNPEIRAKYSFGVTAASGDVVESDPPRRLVQTLRAEWNDEVRAEPESTITWAIEPVGGECRVTVTHSGLREGGSDQIYGGWTMMLSSLKSLLETGTEMKVAAPRQPA